MVKPHMLNAGRTTHEMCPGDIKARKGKWKISIDYALKPDYELLMFFAHFVIIRAEAILSSDCVEYEGYSHLFDPVKDYSEVPEYHFTLTKKVDGNLDIIAIKDNEPLPKKPRLTRRIDG